MSKSITQAASVGTPPAQTSRRSNRLIWPLHQSCCGGIHVGATWGRSQTLRRFDAVVARVQIINGQMSYTMVKWATQWSNELHNGQSVNGQMSYTMVKASMVKWATQWSKRQWSNELQCAAFHLAEQKTRRKNNIPLRWVRNLYLISPKRLLWTGKSDRVHFCPANSNAKHFTPWSNNWFDHWFDQWSNKWFDHCSSPTVGIFIWKKY